jgi:hypothetical protein
MTDKALYRVTSDSIQSSANLISVYLGPKAIKLKNGGGGGLTLAKSCRAWRIAVLLGVGRAAATLATGFSNLAVIGGSGREAGMGFERAILTSRALSMRSSNGDLVRSACWSSPAAKAITAASAQITPPRRTATTEAYIRADDNVLRASVIALPYRQLT